MGSEHFDAAIPIYASAFLPGSDILAVAGGGGEGRHGVENKIILLQPHSSTDEKANGAVQALEKVAEHVFPAGEDTPMTLASTRLSLDSGDSGKSCLVTGVNASRANIESGSNPHLRLLVASPSAGKNSGFNLIETVKTGLFDTKDPETYQRVTAVSPVDGTAAVATSDEKASVYIVKGVSGSDNSNKLKRDLTESPDSIHVRQFAHPVHDLAFSANGQLLAICGPKVILVLRVESGEEVAKLPAPPSRSPKSASSWARVAFHGNNDLVVAANVGKRNKATLSLFHIEHNGRSDLVKSLTVPKGAKAVTALAASSRFIVAGSPGGDVFVYDPQLRLVTVLRSQHSGFPITSASVNDKGLVASTALDGSVVVNTDIKQSKIGLTGTFAWVTASSAVILLIALLLSFVWRMEFADLSVLGASGAQSVDSVTGSSPLAPAPAVQTPSGYIEVPLHPEHVPEGHGPVIPKAAHLPHKPHLPIYDELNAEGANLVQQLAYVESEDNDEQSEQSNSLQSSGDHDEASDESVSGETNEHTAEDDQDTIIPGDASSAANDLLL